MAIKNKRVFTRNERLFVLLGTLLIGGLLFASPANAVGRQAIEDIVFKILFKQGLITSGGAPTAASWGSSLAAGNTSDGVSPALTSGDQLSGGRVNLGSATDSVADGDLAAGDAVSGGLFYDASTKRLSAGQVEIRDVGSNYFILGEINEFVPGTGFHGAQMQGGRAADAAGRRGGDVYLYSGNGPASFDGPAGVVIIGSSTQRGTVSGVTALEGTLSTGASSSGSRGGQTEIQGGTHEATLVARGGDLLLRGGIADGSTSSTGGNLVLEGGLAQDGTAVTGSILIGTGYTSSPTSGFLDVYSWRAPFRISQVPPDITMGDATVPVFAKGRLNVGSTTEAAAEGDLAAGDSTAGGLLLYDSSVGSLKIGAPNLAGLSIGTAVEEVVATIGSATVTTSGLIPAGVTVLHVASRVTTAVTTSSATDTFDMGDSGDADRYGLAIVGTLGTTQDHTDATADPAGVWSSSAREIILDAAGAETFTAGVVTIRVWYLQPTAPGS